MGWMESEQREGSLSIRERLNVIYLVSENRDGQKDCGFT